MTSCKIMNNGRFQRWFGDSKVVDDKGGPLVVYHGTSEEFQSFTPSSYGGVEGGIFFTADIATAQHFADCAAELNGSDGRIIDVYLSIQNPKIIDAEEFMDETLHSFDREFHAVAKARMEGYDGLLIRNVPEGDDRKADQWVVFRSEQIKSATKNKGAFDPTSPNIFDSDPREACLVRNDHWQDDGMSL